MLKGRLDQVQLCKGPLGSPANSAPLLGRHEGDERPLWMRGVIAMLEAKCGVQSLSCVRLFATPWTAARQASLAIPNSWSLPKPMSIESVMPSNHLILCRPLLLPPSIFASIRVFSNETALFASGGQSIGVSASASVLPMIIQD